MYCLLKRNSFILGIAFLIPICAYANECVFGTCVDDPSIFRYIGRTIANGGVMYQVAWDNKGPMLFFPNVLGYLLPGLGNHGPGLVFLMMSISTICFFYKVTRFFVSEMTACCYSVLFSSLCVGNGLGLFMNSQEMAALFFIIPGVFFVLRDKGRVDELTLGVCVGCVFLIKANLISFGGAAIVMWLCDALEKKNWSPFLRRAAYSFMGFVSVLCVVTLGFAFFNAAYDMWDATLLFGLFEYCKFDVSWWAWWRTYLLNDLLPTEGRVLIHYFISVGLALCGLVCLARSKIQRKNTMYLLAWLTFDLVFTFAFKTFYLHYLIVSYAEICILIAIANREVRNRVGAFLIIAWCIGSCFFFCARCRGACSNYIVQQHESIVQCANFFREHYNGGSVFVVGDMFINEVLNEMNISTPQKYYNLPMNYRFAGQERRLKMKEEFEGYILNAPTNSCLLFNRNAENDYRKLFPRAFERKMEVKTMPNGFSVGILL